MKITRNPAAAGRFYPRFKEEIISTIEECFQNKEFGIGHELIVGSNPEAGSRKIIGGVCPHAGYVYSGSAAGCTIQKIFEENSPDTIIILGTQHTGYYDIGLMKEGYWKTPLGNVEVDTEVAQAILKYSKVVKEDDSAFNGFPHGREHNIEVQIPFIQYAAAKANKEIKIVPIKIGKMHFKTLEQLGKDIAHAIESISNKDIAIIASSDMTHYEPRNFDNPKPEIEKVQKVKDQAVIDAFEEFNPEKTLEKASETTVCGPQCITTLMVAGKELGYKKAKPVKYYTSYEKMGNSGPSEYSVGYFSGIITK